MKKLMIILVMLWGIFLGNNCLFANDNPHAISVIYGGIYKNKMIVFFNIKSPEGIKTYWKNPGFGGIAPQFVFESAENIETIKAIYTAPAIVTKQGITNYTLKNDDYIAVSFQPQDPAEPVTVKGVLNYGYCDTQCKAGKFEFNQTFHVNDQANETLLKEFFEHKPIRLTPDMPVHIEAVEGFYNAQKNLLLSLKITGIEALEEDKFVYYLDTDFEINKPMIRKTDADKYQISVDLMNVYQKPQFVTFIFPDDNGKNIISKQKITYKVK